MEKNISPLVLKAKKGKESAKEEILKLRAKLDAGTLDANKLKTGFEKLLVRVTKIPDHSM